MPTVTFSYTVTASLAAPAANFGYAIRVPASTGRQQLGRLHLEIPNSGGSTEKYDPLGNRVLTGVHWGTSGVLTCTMSGKALIDPAQPDPGDPVPYSEITEHTACGSKLRTFFLHHSSLGSAAERASHFSRMLRDEFSFSRTLESSPTAEQALTLGRGTPEDAAHILLSLCRLDGIPARYIAGICRRGAAAWIEVWENGCWTPVDPRTGSICDHTYLKVAHGRDSSDILLAALSCGEPHKAEYSGTLSIDLPRT